MLIKAGAFLFISLMLFGSDCKATTPVRKCPGDLPFPLYVQIADCEELPCTITAGNTIQMEVQFVAIKDVTNFIDIDVRVTMLGVTVPYAVPKSIGDVCQNLMYGAYCPLYHGEDVTYHVGFPVDMNVLEINVKAEIKLLDLDKDIVACYIADLKIKKPKKSAE